MNALNIIYAPGSEVDGVAGWPGGAAELIRALWRQWCCADRGKPLTAVGPGGFSCDQVHVGRIGVSAQEQVGIIIRREEENVIRGQGRMKSPLMRSCNCCLLAGRRFERGKISHETRRGLDIGAALKVARVAPE